MNKKNITILLSVLLGLFLLSGFWYFGFRDSLSTQEVAQKALDYINDNLLPEGSLASLINAVEKEDIIEVNLSIDGRSYSSYVTKKGNFFFVEGIDLNKEIFIVKEEIREEVVQSERPKIDLFIMSYCPYGLQAQKAFLPVYELLSDKADMNVRFVSYIMHDKKEIDENLRQYCIQKEEKEKYDDYLGCFIENGSYEKENFEICLESVNVNRGNMNDWLLETDQNYNIYSQYENRDTWLDGMYPKFDVESDLNEQYGVAGSPTLVINDIVVVSTQQSCPAGKECVVIPDMKRTPEGYKEIICQAFVNQPEECAQVLSGDSFAAGFGLEETAESSDASCQ